MLHKNNNVKDLLSKRSFKVNGVSFKVNGVSADENLTDPLMKLLARENVMKTSKRVGLLPLER